MRKEARSPNSASKTLKPFGGFAFDLGEHIAFLQSFLREPASVGALSPSSKALARTMIEGFALKSADTVVELGPGTGAFTAPIREQIGRHTTFLTMELAPLCPQPEPERGVYPALHGKKRANYIVSGFWANLPGETGAHHGCNFESTRSRRHIHDVCLSARAGFPAQQFRKASKIGSPM
jgi:phospholipid N-methyltransferase